LGYSAKCSSLLGTFAVADDESLTDVIAEFECASHDHV
jgi:hypothetical protein